MIFSIMLLQSFSPCSSMFWLDG